MGEKLVADAGASFARKKILSEVTNKENNSLGEKTVSMLNSENLFIFENDLERPSSPSISEEVTRESQVIQKIRIHGKIKGWAGCLLNAKRVSPRLTKESKPTIIVRNEAGKILLNALLYLAIKTSLQKNTVVAIFHTSGNAGGSGDNDSVVASTFLI